VFGSLLDSGGIGLNLVELETANGASVAAIVLLLSINDTACGSAKSIYPALLLILNNIKTVWGCISIIP
jgi:hypothetical protein